MQPRFFVAGGHIELYLNRNPAYPTADILRWRPPLIWIFLLSQWFPIFLAFLLSLILFVIMLLKKPKGGVRSWQG